MTTILSEVVTMLKYARYLPDKGRRENWEEIVARNKAMHQRKFHDNPVLSELDQVYEKVLQRQILPSMRSLQFGGLPIESNNTRMYNCAYLPISDAECFSESIFLLLSGCGVGYSVQRQHVALLPSLSNPLPKRKYVIADSIEGWADAVKALLNAYLAGAALPEFDYSAIRPAGSLLKTAGGRAPGPEPLRRALEACSALLAEKQPGTRLSPLECHDIMCHLAECVVAGGTRRSALLVLFSADDQEMLKAKSGNWWEKNAQRARANNSVALDRETVTHAQFQQLWSAVEESKSGEPGLYFSNNLNQGVNPCCVAGDTWILTESGPRQVKELINNPLDLIVNGNAASPTSTGFFETGTKELFQVELASGHIVKTTSDHQFLTNDGWKELSLLKIGDTVLLSNHRGQTPLTWDGFGTHSAGWLVGEIIGDGGIIENQNAAYLRFWGESAGYMRELAVNLTRETVKVRADFTGQESKTNPWQQVKSTGLYDLLQTVGFLNGNKTATAALHHTSSEFQRGFVRGLFDADGTVSGNVEKGISVRLSQCDVDLLIQVQRILARFGIGSKIYTNRNPAGTRMMPDGHGGLAPYECRATNDLVVSKDNLFLFRDLIGFYEPAKHEKLNTVLTSYKSRGPYRETFTSEIRSITSVGVEPVYDVTVDGVHEFDGNGIRLHNCEIALKPFQYCNLCEINVDNVSSQDDLNSRVKAAAFLGTLQASYTKFTYLRPIWQITTESEALLGLGMTGIGSGRVLQYDLKEAARVALAENERVAKLIGIRPAARVTTIKPSGCSRGDTLLATEKGLLSLDELRNGDAIWQPLEQQVAVKGGFRKASQFFINGKAATKRITLASGLELESTLNHQYQFGDVWRRVDEIKVNDEIPYELNFNQTKEDPIATFESKVYQLDHTLAWLCGIYFVHRSFPENSKLSNTLQAYFGSTEITAELRFFQQIDLAIVRKCKAYTLKRFIDGCYFGQSTITLDSKQTAQQLLICMRSVGYDGFIRADGGQWVVCSLAGHEAGLDRVVSIEDSECETFDIEVPELHAYLANSFVSHNTSSLLLGCSSGIHPWYAPHYIRRIRVSKREPFYEFFKQRCPQLIEDDLFNANDAVVSFPVSAPEGSIFRQESPMELLQRVHRFNTEWIATGHRSGDNRHNVSATISIKPDEWQAVGHWMWENRNDFNGLSVLDYDLGTYKQAPHEECSVEKIAEMKQYLQGFDLSELVEAADLTDFMGEAACSGDKCERKK